MSTKMYTNQKPFIFLHHTVNNFIMVNAKDILYYSYLNDSFEKREVI